MISAFRLKWQLNSARRNVVSWQTAVAILGIPICIMMDNIRFISPHLRMGTGSLFFYLFHTLSFSGLFGAFVTPLCCVPPIHAWCRASRAQRTVPYPYLSAALYGGTILCSGYLLLFVSLRMLMPPLTLAELTSIQESAALGVFMPYNKYYLAGLSSSIFLSVLFYGFLMGALYGAVAAVASAFTSKYWQILLAPLLFRLGLTYGSAMLGIPDTLRLDQWCAMRAVFISEELTLLLSAGTVSAALWLMHLLYAKKLRRHSVPAQPIPQ